MSLGCSWWWSCRGWKLRRSPVTILKDRMNGWQQEEPQLWCTGALPAPHPTLTLMGAQAARAQGPSRVRPTASWMVLSWHWVETGRHVSSGTDLEAVTGSRWRALTHLHLALDPGPNGIGLCSELAPQTLVGMLAGQLLLQRLVPDGHELLHLPGFKGNRG